MAEDVLHVQRRTDGKENSAQSAVISTDHFIRPEFLRGLESGADSHLPLPVTWKLPELVSKEEVDLLLGKFESQAFSTCHFSLTLHIAICRDLQATVRNSW